MQCQQSDPPMGQFAKRFHEVSCIQDENKDLGMAAVGEDVTNCNYRSSNHEILLIAMKVF